MNKINGYIFLILGALSTGSFSYCNNKARKQESPTASTATREATVTLVKQALELQMRIFMLKELQERVASLKEEAHVHPRNAELKETIIALEEVIKEFEYDINQLNDQDKSLSKAPSATPSPNKLALEILMTMQLIEELTFKAEALKNSKKLNTETTEELAALELVIQSLEEDIQTKRGLLAHITKELVC